MRSRSILVLVAVMVLAGCEGSAVGGSAPSSGAVSSPAQSATLAAGSAAAGSKGPIKIGILLPLTGPQASAGKDYEDGLNLYLSSVHSSLAGRTIQPIFADDQFKADVSLTKAHELVENEHVAALMGIAGTSSAYAVAQWVQQTAHVPMLVTSNAAGEGLLTDPKYKSPYLSRWTQTITQIVDVSADWAAKQGYKKAGLVVSDNAAGVQIADIFASTFIRRGGAIVQEQYPALGTTDFAPFLAQLNSDTDVLFTFLPAIDGLRFADQYGDYSGQHKPQIIGSFGTLIDGPSLAQLKDKVIGIVGVDVFTDASDDPGTQAFVKAWQAAYPDRPLTHDPAAGYVSGQVLAAALGKVNGAIEDTQPFLQALNEVNIDSAKGPVKLDANRDIVQNIEVFRIVKTEAGVGDQLIDTYQGINDTWARSAEEIATFPWESFKGKWAGMTNAQLDAALQSH